MNELIPLALLVFIAAIIGIELWKKPAARQLAAVIAIVGSFVAGGLLSERVSQFVLPLMKTTGVTMAQRLPLLTVAASLAILWPLCELLAKLWLRHFPARRNTRRGSAVALGLIATTTAFAFVVGHLPTSLAPAIHTAATTRVVNTAARPILDTLNFVGAGAVGINGLHGGAPQPVLDSPTERAAEESVAHISVVADTPRGQVMLSGSGWYIAPQLVATAAHVVAGGRTITVTPRGGETVAAELVHLDTLVDIALLRTAAPGRPIPLADSVTKGERGVGAGYPHITVGTPFTRLGYRFVQDREITDVPVNGGAAARRLISSFQGSAYHGESGAPIIDDQGQVIGQVAQAIEGQEMMVAVPIASIRAALARTDGDVAQLPVVDAQESVLG